MADCKKEILEEDTLEVDKLLADGEKSYRGQLWMSPLITIGAAIFMNVHLWRTGQPLLPLGINLVFVVMAVPFLVEIGLRRLMAARRRGRLKKDWFKREVKEPCSVCENAKTSGGHGKETCVNRMTNAPPTPRGSGLVIACSGGGIKSASFCLGALQQLDEQGTYAKASHLVAVSGGGYAATAFSLASRDDDDDGRILGVNSRQLAMLRRRTNYLADSPRTKLQLIASLVLGAMSGLLGVAFIIFIVASVVGTYARLIGAEGSYLVGLVPAIFFFMTAVGMFLWDRFRAGPHHPAHSPTDPWYTRQQRLAFWSVIWVLAVPGLIWSSQHGFGLASVPVALHVFSEGWSEWAAAVTTLSGLLVLIGVSVKGAHVTDGSGGALGAVRVFFRRWIAPILSLVIITLMLYALAVSLARHWTGGEGGWFVVLPPIVALAYIVGARLGNANRYTLHTFYQDRLGWAYIGSAKYTRKATKPVRKGEERKPAAPEQYLALKDFDLDAADIRPELVLCATATVLDVDKVPTGRTAASFVMSKSRMGFTDTLLPGGGCVRPPHDFSVFLGQPVAVASAMAIAGAALSPLSGRETQTHAPFRILMALCNVRLGVWLRNPYWLARDCALKQEREQRREASRVRTTAREAWDGVNGILELPSPGRRFVAEAFGRPLLGAPLVYVTDGGHYDNLALVESLRLEPSRIIMLDGSGDARDTFTTIGRAIALARIDLGVEIALDPRPMRRGTKRYSRSGIVSAMARWPDGHMCQIDYVKSVLPRGMSWDVESYRIEHPDFPETSEQLEQYNEFDFEAFRQLGYCLAKQIP